MANEISISVTIAAQKNGAGVGGSFSGSADMTGNKMVANVQEVGTSAEQLVTGDMATIGQLFVKNLDDTNYVDIALDNLAADVFARLQPGKVCLVPLNAAAVYAKANTAACDVQVIAIEA